MQTKQSGAALIVSLILLLVLTSIALTGGQNIVLQERMTSAIRDSHVSLELAESGLRDANAEIAALQNTIKFNNTDGLYSTGNGPTDLFAKNTWANANTADGTTTISGKAARFIIEHLGILPEPNNDSGNINMMGYGQTTGGGDVHGFKIITRSMGVNESTERILVSYYGKRF